MKLRSIWLGAALWLCLGPMLAEERKVAGDTLSGAAKGAIVGGIAGDVGAGAAAGAVGSALFGSMRRNQ